ncbi:MAG: YaiO family outer membrane beta-barrel protein [Gemmatimonadaceae bacterium]
MNASLPRRACLLLALLAATAVRATPAAAQDASVVRDTAVTRTVAADVSYVTFSGSTDPWRLASVSLSRRTKAGSVIARVNYANRFATDGVQVEADAYPRVGKKTYLYLNAGYSGATVFPEWRFGGEAFVSLPSAWEASAGFRQLRFGGAPVTLFTGAVGKYVGNYWFSLRPFLRSKEGGLSASAGLTARRYFEDGDHWVGATASYGSSPTDRITPDAVGRTDAFSMSLNGSTGLTPRMLLTWTLGHDAEELAPGSTRTSATFTAGLKVTF